MLSKTETHLKAGTKTLFDEEHQFIAPGLQKIALLSELAIDHGSGATLTDVDGRTYLDLNAGVSVASLGHAHPRALQRECDLLLRETALPHRHPPLPGAQYAGFFTLLPDQKVGRTSSLKAVEIEAAAILFGASLIQDFNRNAARWEMPT